jgi:EAL domain-containing protein (putative c-di-GMP-specific phosphodiesterase class I)
MSSSIKEADGLRQSVKLPELPSLVVLLDQIQQRLVRCGELGLLSITALQREPSSRPDCWEDYEATLREISLFLTRFTGSRMRRSDSMLDPIVAGNTFVVLIGPPRDDRSLNLTDVAPVRHRLSRRLKGHLRRRLTQAAFERYGVYVGGAMMRFDPSVDCRRIIYHCLEEAFADALGRRKKETHRQAVQLQHILRGGEVAMVYQPLVDMIERRVIGFEALTRLPNGQFATPELLFKVAHEQRALWAVERLCRTRALERLPSLDGSQRLFLNTEPDSFHDPQLRQPSFLKMLEGRGLEPQRVVLELTEHTAVTDFAAMRRALEDVRAIGYRLAMDDVGSGYAGLQTIAEIRPDYLKVDMSLVRNLHLDPIKRELIETIRRFSDSTGITLVAEGVESPEELASLASVGVRCAQGYLFARPDSPPNLPDWADLISKPTTR